MKYPKGKVQFFIKKIASSANVIMSQKILLQTTKSETNDIIEDVNKDAVK